MESLRFIGTSIELSQFLAQRMIAEHALVEIDLVTKLRVQLRLTHSFKARREK
jgi:hypothetical protein